MRFSFLRISATFSCLVAFAWTATGQCLTPASGLIAWWRGEGNPFDSVGANDGIVMGGLGFGEGLAGRGFHFTGIGDEYVRLPNKAFTFPNEGLAAAPFSFELWFKTTSTGAMLGQQDVTPFAIPDDGYVPALYIGTNGQLYAYMFWGLDDVLVSSNAVNDGQWHHLAITYSSAEELLYLDGHQVAMMWGAQFGYSPAYQYQIGTAYTGGWPGAPGTWYPFNGTIDEIGSYNRALSAEEVRAIYEAGSAGKCIGPVLRQRYSFNEPPGSRLVPDAKREAHGVILYSSQEPPFTNGIPDGTDFTGEGKLRLNGTSGYVQLPSNLASWLSVATFEVWVTWYGPATSVWQRIFDFGFNDKGVNASGTGTNHICLSPARGGTEAYGFEQTTVNPFGSVTDPKSVVLEASTHLPIGREVYLAVTYDHLKGSSHFFVDGTLLASVSGKDLNPLKSIKDINCWLGRSQWTRDPHFAGEYNEFRIWDGVLSASEIAAHHLAGPDQNLTPVSSPYLTAFLVPEGIVLSWPESFSGFQLESASRPDASSWNPVTEPGNKADGYWTVVVPHETGPRYYRLRR